MLNLLTAGACACAYVSPTRYVGADAKPQFVSYDALQVALNAYAHNAYVLNRGGNIIFIPHADIKQKDVEAIVGVTSNSILPISIVQPPTVSTMTILADLRGISGLTVKELSHVLHVTPKTIHNWQNGGSVASENLRTLSAVLETVLYLDRGNSDANRVMLHAPLNGGGTLLQMLAAEKHQDIRALCQPGRGRAAEADRLDAKQMERLAPVHAGEQLLAAANASSMYVDDVPEYRLRKVVARRKSL